MVGDGGGGVVGGGKHTLCGGVDGVQHVLPPRKLRLKRLQSGDDGVSTRAHTRRRASRIWTSVTLSPSWSDVTAGSFDRIQDIWRERRRERVPGPARIA